MVITFDADTTIVSLNRLSDTSILTFPLQGSCHSNCGPITCDGSVCTITYTGSIPMELFNVKKTDASGDSDRSNIISVTVNGAEQCSADEGPSGGAEETTVSSGGSTPSASEPSDSNHSKFETRPYFWSIDKH